MRRITTFVVFSLILVSLVHRPVSVKTEPTTATQLVSFTPQQVTARYLKLEPMPMAAAPEPQSFVSPVIVHHVLWAQECARTHTPDACFAPSERARVSMSAGRN